MSTQIEQTVSCIIEEIDKFLASPFSERVVIPLMLDHWVAHHILSALHDHYLPRYPGDLLVLNDRFLATNIRNYTALHLDNKVVVYEADEALARPTMLRGEGALMYVIDKTFEDFRSKYLDRTMAATLSTARMNGFAGTIHKDG